jgi:hypothetical protein
LVDGIEDHRGDAVALPCLIPASAIASIRARRSLMAGAADG